jgi:hypothetical protein
LAERIIIQMMNFQGGRVAAPFTSIPDSDQCLYVAFLMQSTVFRFEGVIALTYGTSWVSLPRVERVTVITTPQVTNEHFTDGPQDVIGVTAPHRRNGSGLFAVADLAHAVQTFARRPSRGVN